MLNRQELWCARFVAAENARVLVVRTVVSMRIDRGGARLQPHAWLAGRRRDRLSNDPRRQHARLQDLLSIRSGVAAVDAAAGQIDHDIAAVDLALPIAEGRAIPGDDAPRPCFGMTAQDDHVVAILLKCASENRPDLSGSAWNDDLHTDSPSLDRRSRNSVRAHVVAVRIPIQAPM